MKNKKSNFKGLIPRRKALKEIGKFSVGLPLIFKFSSKGYFLKEITELNNDPDFAPLFPFSLSHEPSSGITNFNHLLEAPAGKFGFIRAEGDKLLNTNGEMFFNGTNLTGSANFPTKMDADKLSSRLAGLGINCVRLHYMDADYGNFKQEKEHGIIKPKDSTQRELDLGQLDRLDYLIASLKKKGIYVNINLHVARWWDERDGFLFKEYRPSFDKGVDNFYPSMIELQKEYARKLLTHYNPYTLSTYTDEPTVAFVEINNENSLFSQYFSGNIDKLPDPYAYEFKKLWNEWLKNKYKDIDSLKRIWQENISGKKAHEKTIAEDSHLSFLFEKGALDEFDLPTIPNNIRYGRAVEEDFCEFIAFLEDRYWLEMYKFLKEDLGVKSLISGTQVGYYGLPQIQGRLDYVDNHAYWNHPNPVNPDWRILNTAMVNSMFNVERLSAEKVASKPYVISEYNHPFPNQFGAEGMPILWAYGKFQGWNGVFEYNYHDRRNYDTIFNEYFFGINERPDVLAHLRACSAIFLRGDVKTSKGSWLKKINEVEYMEFVAQNKSVSTHAFLEKNDLLNKEPFEVKTAIEIVKDSELKHVGKFKKSDKINKETISETQELYWNKENPNKGYFKVDTENCLMFTGFPEDRSISFKNKMSIEVGRTRLGWATISVVSKWGNPLNDDKNPVNILIVATGLTRNMGMKVENLNNDKIRLKDWGQGPVYAEGIPFKLTGKLLGRKKIECFSLDNMGARREKIEVVESKNKSTYNIQFQPENRAIWYELAIN